MHQPAQRGLVPGRECRRPSHGLLGHLLFRKRTVPLNLHAETLPGSLRRNRRRSENGYVIARIWHGWAPGDRADDYQRHYESGVADSLLAVRGFRGAQLLRRNEGGEVVFTSITWFTDLNAVRDFAGDDYEAAVVDDAGAQALNRWDERVAHHEVVFTT
jgi:heme-degrading monooxygenase HmoA